MDRINTKFVVGDKVNLLRSYTFEFEPQVLILNYKSGGYVKQFSYFVSDFRFKLSTVLQKNMKRFFVPVENR